MGNVYSGCGEGGYRGERGYHGEEREEEQRQQRPNPLPMRGLRGRVDYSACKRTWDLVVSGTMFGEGWGDCYIAAGGYYSGVVLALSNKRRTDEPNKRTEQAERREDRISDVGETREALSHLSGIGTVEEAEEGGD